MLTEPDGVISRLASNPFAALSFAAAVAAMMAPTSKGAVQSQGSGTLTASRVIVGAVVDRPIVADEGRCKVPLTWIAPIVSPLTYASPPTVATPGGVRVTGPALCSVFPTSRRPF